MRRDSERRDARGRPYALVIGASTTIGAEYARQLAERGYDLIIVARRSALLEALASEICAWNEVAVRPLALDLLEDGAVERLLALAARLPVEFVVCNANLHRVGLFENMDLDTKLRMVRINSELPMRVAHALGPAMIERGRGHLLFVNALNCLTALEFDAVFQATKSFLLVFGESLWAEYRRHGVKVGVSMVSGIEGSESYEKKLSPLKRTLVQWAGASMSPERIVTQSLKQLDAGECILIPDVAVPVNRLGYQLGIAARSARSGTLTRAMSGFYRWLLDGEEARAAGLHGSQGANDASTATATDPQAADLTDDETASRLPTAKGAHAARVTPFPARPEARP